MPGPPTLLRRLTIGATTTGASVTTTIVPATTMAFGSFNESSHNCTNDYCIPDEEYIDMMETYVFPTGWEWLLIGLHSVVFVAGLLGNALVCLAVYRCAAMRTVTNCFLVNLAVADFLVILLCLPPTVIWDVTETWFMGMILCKIVLYFQVRSVGGPAVRGGSAPQPGL